MIGGIVGVIQGPDRRRVVGQPAESVKNPRVGPARIHPIGHSALLS